MERGVESGEENVTDEISHSAGPKYSIVIPAFNESARIPATLKSVLDCIRARGWEAEVIVVNDGSTDATAEVVRAFARTAPEVRLIENPGNRGKGYSVRAGMLQARAKWRSSPTQISLPPSRRPNASLPPSPGRGHRHRLPLVGERPPDSPPAALPPVLRPLLQRRTRAGHAPALRRHPVADSKPSPPGCPDRLPAPDHRALGLRPGDLLIALKRGYRVVEVPVSSANDERTRMSYLRDGVKVLEEIAMIRWNALRGRYNRPV